jgi:hypothetical protein
MQCLPTGDTEGESGNEAVAEHNVQAKGYGICPAQDEYFRKRPSEVDAMYSNYEGGNEVQEDDDECDWKVLSASIIKKGNESRLPNPVLHFNLLCSDCTGGNRRSRVYD